MAKKHLEELETAEDYNKTKKSIAKSLWGEKLEDIKNAINDVQEAHELKVTPHQQEMHDKAVQEYRISRKQEYKKLTYEML